MGIPQITAIMGMCVAGGAYLPVMCDHILMTDGSGLFLAGPALVQAAIGQRVSAEELGGAKMHAQVSGTVDFREPHDEACLERIRTLVGMMGGIRAEPRFDRIAPSCLRPTRPKIFTASFPPIRRGNTTCARSSRESWTAAVLRNIAPNMARPFSAAMRASAAGRWASSPIRRCTFPPSIPPRASAVWNLAA